MDEGEAVDLHVKAETWWITDPLCLCTESHGAVMLTAEGADGPTSFFPTGLHVCSSSCPFPNSLPPSLPPLCALHPEARHNAQSETSQAVGWRDGR